MSLELQINQLDATAIIDDTDVIAKDIFASGTGITKKITIADLAAKINLSNTFKDLADVNAPYAFEGFLTHVNATTNGMTESTTRLAETLTDRFQFSRGTSNLNVYSSCIIDQDLEQSASPIFDALTLSSLNVVNGIVKTDVAGNLSSSTALPDGTTAITQILTDATTKVATCEFVKNHPGTSKWKEGVGYLVPLDLNNNLSIGIDQSSINRVHIHKNATASSTIQCTNLPSGTEWDDGLSIGVQSDAKGNIRSKKDLLFRVPEYIGKITYLAGEIVWENNISAPTMSVSDHTLIERDGLGDECLNYFRNINGGSAQEYHEGLLVSGYGVRDVTHTTLPFSIAPAAPNNTLKLTALGQIGFGTAVFTGTDFINMTYNGTPLAKLKTNGLLTSEVANYENLVSARGDFVNKGYVDDLPITPFWKILGDFLVPVDINKSVDVPSGESYFISGDDINTGGILPNVAYLDQANVFVEDQTIEKTPILSQAKYLIKVGAGGEGIFGVDIDSGSINSGEMNVSGGWITFARQNESHTANDILRMRLTTSGTDRKGITKIIFATQIIGTGIYNTLDSLAYSTFNCNTISGNITINGISGGVDGQKVHIYKSNPASTLIVNHISIDAAVGDKIICPKGIAEETNDYGLSILIYDVAREAWIMSSF